MFKHCVIVFLVSMVPLIELRGAIPYGVVYDLPLWLTYIVAIAGNMLPVPIIYLFARRVLLWGKDKKLIGRFFTFCLEKGEKAFVTQITAYEPKLEAPNLPAHLGIDEALKLEAYVVGEADGVTPEWSVSDEKIAVIEDGKLIGKADGVVTVTAVHGEMKSQWPVAVGTAELPAAEDEEENEDDDDGFGWLTIIGGVIIIGGATFFFLRRKRK